MIFDVDRKHRPRRGGKRVNVKYPEKRGYSFERDLDTNKSRTKNLMIKYETARNNNLFVVCKILREQIGIKIPDLTEEQLRCDGIIETTLRNVRTIQHTEGVLLPTSPEIRRKRKISDEEWEKWVGIQKGRDRVIV